MGTTTTHRRPMTYQKHGNYIRDLNQLPKKLRKEIQETEEKIKQIDETNREGRRKYNKHYNKLVDLKNRANSIQPTWRKDLPDQWQKTTPPKT